MSRIVVFERAQTNKRRPPNKIGAPPTSLWQKVPLIFQTNEKVHLP